MRSYGRVPTDFWIEAKEKQLSDDGRQLMVYLMTCHHGNCIGCFRIPVAYIAEDLCWGFERVTETLSETVSKGFLDRDENRSWNRLPNHFEMVSIANPNVAKGMEQFIDAVPKDSPIFNNLLNSLQPFAERFRKGYLNGLANPLLNGFETEAAVSSSSLENNTNSFFTESVREAEPVDKSGKKKIDLNLKDYTIACVVVAKMLHRHTLTVNDQQILKLWCLTHDMERYVLPWLEARVKNYMSKNNELPANPLSYFHAGLTEHLLKCGIK